MRRRRLTALVMAMLISTAAMAFTTHKVKSKDTPYGIAKEYNLSWETILRYNPEAASGLRKGMKLRIPEAEDLAAANIKDQPAEASQPEGTEYSDEISELMKSAFADNDSVESEFGDPALFSEGERLKSFPFPGFGARTQNVMLTLPFMTSETERSRQSQLNLDFYKGFLLSLEEKGTGRYPMNLLVEDSGNSTEQMEQDLVKAVAGNVKLLIAPESNAELQMALDFGKNKHCYVLNLFNVKDESYLTNPYSIQANIPQHMMYKKAISYLLNEMAGYTPVIISPRGAKAEKESFITALKRVYSAKHLQVIDIECGASLMPSDLEKLNPDGKYVFIPKSGTINVFNKIASCLSDYRAGRSDPRQIRVFGYPDWIAYKGDHLRALHSLEAIYYSRVFLDPENTQVKDVEAAYDQWYDGRPLEGVPMQSFLGYDTAGLIHYLLNLGPLSGIHEMDSIDYQGLQSAFHLTRKKDGGFVNTALYIVECKPGSAYNVKVK